MSSRPSLDIRAYVQRPHLAIPLLAELLSAGNLALAIGAGASRGLGLPGWRELVDRCLRETDRLKGTRLANSLPGDADNKRICESIDEVEKAIGGKLDMGRSPAFRSLVSSCLYPDSHYDKSILKQELLIAVGALLMGSRRGSVREVFNFNFDDVLDWYLSLHGYDTQIITSLPTLRRETDVTIYHPHGYIPLDMKHHPGSDFLILSQHAYEEKLGDRLDPWLMLFEQAMVERVFLFVGLSGDDQTFGQTITNVQKKVEKQRVSAYWVFGPGVDESRMRYLENRNIVPLRLGAFEEIPEFILNICQQALVV